MLSSGYHSPQFINGSRKSKKGFLPYTFVITIINKTQMIHFAILRTDLAKINRGSQVGKFCAFPFQTVGDFQKSIEVSYCGKRECVRLRQLEVLRRSPYLHKPLQSGSFLSCLQLQAQNYTRNGAVSCFSPVCNHCRGFRCAASDLSRP